MVQTLAVLLTLWLSLQGTGFSYIPLDDTGAPVDTGAFTFTVEAAGPVEEYAGLRPAQGWRLADVSITTTNTGDTGMVLCDWYYSLHWGPTYLDWDYCYLALADEMAPLEYYLAPGQSVTWHYLYEIPEGAINPCITHIQYGENEDGERDETARFTVFIPLLPSE